MRVVWMVIVAATGAMSLIAASLLAQPYKRSEHRPPFEDRAESHFVCLDCAYESEAGDRLAWSR